MHREVMARAFLPTIRVHMLLACTLLLVALLPHTATSDTLIGKWAPTTPSCLNSFAQNSWCGTFWINKYLSAGTYRIRRESSSSAFEVYRSEQWGGTTCSTNKLNYAKWKVRARAFAFPARASVGCVGCGLYCSGMLFERFPFARAQVCSTCTDESSGTCSCGTMELYSGGDIPTPLQCFYLKCTSAAGCGANPWELYFVEPAPPPAPADYSSSGSGSSTVPVKKKNKSGTDAGIAILAIGVCVVFARFFFPFFLSISRL